MNSKAAAIMLGATVGLGTLVFGAPLWAGVLLGSAAAVATKKAIDKSA